MFQLFILTKLLFIFTFNSKTFVIEILKSFELLPCNTNYRVLYSLTLSNSNKPEIRIFLYLGTS